MEHAKYSKLNTVYMEWIDIRIIRDFEIYRATSDTWL